MAVIEFPNAPEFATDEYVANLRAVYRTVRSDLHGLLPRLRGLGYNPNSPGPVPGPDPDYLAVYRPRYLRIAEEPPAAWDLFLREVGPVNLVANMQVMERAPDGTLLELFPQPWHIAGVTGPIYLDPLQVWGTVFPEWEAPRGIRQPGASGYVEVCADTIHKAGWSGAGATHFDLPATSPDPILVNDNPVWPDGLTFTEMLRQSMSWFGLPGLRRLPALPPALRELREEYAHRYGE